MKGSRKNVSRRVRKMKSRVRAKFVSKSKRQHRHKTRRQRGGNNTLLSNSYSTGGVLSANLSALANPVPYMRLDNTNCPSSYNHFK